MKTGFMIDRNLMMTTKLFEKKEKLKLSSARDLFQSNFRIDLRAEHNDSFGMERSNRNNLLQLNMHKPLSERRKDQRSDTLCNCTKRIKNK